VCKKLCEKGVYACVCVCICEIVYVCVFVRLCICEHPSSDLNVLIVIIMTRQDGTASK
jgi:hypothetical protein